MGICREEIEQAKREEEYHNEQNVSDVAMDTDYAEKTAKIQKETLSKSYAVAVDQLKTITFPEGNAVCILDLGSADGVNTIPFFKSCISEVRQRDKAKPVQLVFEDQPCNDFTRIHKLEPKDFGTNCFPSTTSIGFFDQTVPPGTVQLSYSSHAMHYLAGPPPCNIKKGLHHTDGNAEEKAMFAEAAAKDWERLLLARASELAVGGRAVLSNLCIDDEGRHYGSTERTGRSLYLAIADALRSMVVDGKLTEQEFEWATSPEYYRTVAEHKKPFEDASGAVVKSGIVLKSAEVHISRCALRAEWEAGVYTSAQEYSLVFADVCTSFSYHKCMRAFKHPSNTRSDAEQHTLIDEVYDRLAKMVEAEPMKFAIEQINLVMVIEKQAPTTSGGYPQK